MYFSELLYAFTKKIFFFWENEMDIDNKLYKDNIPWYKAIHTVARLVVS